MWKPPQRIKYTAVEEDWPSASEAAASRLFSPLRAGPLTLDQRTWIPAMVPWRSNEEGEVTADVLQWYERFARGKPGAIVVEATGIRDIPSGPLLRIGDDRYIPGLKKLVDVVREASEGQTRLLIQIIDFLPIRRRPDPEKFLRRFLAVGDHHRQALDLPGADEAAVREALLALEPGALQAALTPKEWEDMQMGYRERVTDTHIPGVADLPRTLPGLFADAARRAEEAGFDGVELHYAHAYTMASFLSATNTREDGYGGAREGRVRLPLEVYRAVREATGDQFAVGCRFLSDEIIDGGNRVDDACYFARCFAEAGMDFLSLSRGGKFDDAKQPKVGWAAYPYTGQSGYECMPGYISDEQGPFGRNIEPVAAIRQTLQAHQLDIPVVVAGGIFGFKAAEDILREDKADIIGFARQALADPDWFEKVRTGYGPQVIVCRYSNYCEGLDQKHKQVTCELWDREQLDEPGVALTVDGKRRMVAPAWKPR
ncbi:NADH:flavin oxidoreductase [Parahaliea mediterranea]|uniref:NADH:flavin oxidoreductase n=1 Tax=Parahaliea mediterranea TaxID=651086 RepID=A0A939IKJ0_9GAMM|nr:NADH:flavin oxidoreductase [Parahaliea mediterranea]MBN7797371.1 NADH:flavin oxidoreductase [Parahaliea mediterranea]